MKPGKPLVRYTPLASTTPLPRSGIGRNAGPKLTTSKPKRPRATGPDKATVIAVGVVTRPDAPVKVRHGDREWKASCLCCPEWNAVGPHPFVLRTAISHTNPKSFTTCQGGNR